MRYLLTLLITYFSLFVPISLGNSKPNFRFEHLFENLNASHRPIGSFFNILKDQDGMIWLGGEQIYRFDGIEVQQYPKTNSQQHSTCASYLHGMALDHSGVIWLSTELGVCYFDKSQDNFIPFELLSQKKHLTTTNTITVDSNNKIYIGMPNEIAIVSADRKNIDFHTVQPAESFEGDNNEFHNIFIESDDSIWIASLYSGLIHFTPSSGAVRRFMNTPETPNAIPSNDVRDIAQDKEGYLWFSMGQGGISKLNPNRTEMTHYYDGTKTKNSLSVWSLFIDSEDRLWANTNGRGLMGYDPNLDLFFHYSHNSNDRESIGSNKTVVTVEDHDNNLWVSLYPSGIDIINRHNTHIKTYKKIPHTKNTLSDSNILRVFIDSQNNIWVGTEGGLNLFLPESNSFINYSAPSPDHWSINNSPITTIREKNADELWIGTWSDGLYLVNKASGSVKHYATTIQTREDKRNDTVDSDYIWDSIEYGDKTLFTTEGKAGLMVFDHKTETFSREKFKDSGHPLTISHAYSLLRDAKNNLWVSSVEGLYRIDGKEPILYSNRTPINNESIPSFRIRSLHEGKDGRIWAGTEDNGAFIYDYASNSFTQLGEAQGLPSISIACIAETSDGFIWLFSQNGIIKVDPQTLATTTYNNANGLISSNFNRTSCLIDKNDNIYAGGAEGLSLFNAKDITNTNDDFPVHITYLKTFNEQDAGHQTSTQNILYHEKISLNHHQRMFAIGFAALSYSLAQWNEYAYKLDNFENEWNYSRNGNSATYTNIPPGKYTFLVKGRSSDGRWSKNIDALTIDIATPPWLSWWAYSLYASLTAFLLYTAIRLKIRKDERDNINAINVEKIRLNKEKEEMRNNFIADVSHELRTPLAILTGEMEAIVDGVRPLSTASLESLNCEVRIVNKLVTDLFDLSLFDTSDLSYDMQPLDIMTPITQAIAMMYNKLDDKGIHVQLQASEAPYNVTADSDRMMQLFLNLLENCYRYTFNDGQVIIFVKREGRKIVITIDDSKPSVSPENIEHIFQRFYREEKSRNRASGGNGLGLSICKNIADAHNAKITAVPSNIGGLCITLEFDGS